MASKKHIHKYGKVKGSSREYWACRLPNCSHYLPENVELQIVNKKTICWICDKPTAIMNERNLKLRFPICDKCADYLKEIKETRTDKEKELLRKIHFGEL